MPGGFSGGGLRTMTMRARPHARFAAAGLAAVIAAVIGLALSFILLDRQRGVFATGLQQRAGTRRRITDETAEDELGGAGDQNASAPASPKP